MIKKNNVFYVNAAKNIFVEESPRSHAFCNGRSVHAKGKNNLW